jgi:hypothetical protein
MDVVGQDNNLREFLCSVFMVFIFSICRCICRCLRLLYLISNTSFSLQFVDVCALLLRVGVSFIFLWGTEASLVKDGEGEDKGLINQAQKEEAHRKANEEADSKAKEEAEKVCTACSSSL